MTQGEHRSPVCLNSWEICLTLLTQRKLIIETVRVICEELKRKENNLCSYLLFDNQTEIMMTKLSGGPRRQRGGAGSGGPSVRFNCESSARAQAGA